MFPFFPNYAPLPQHQQPQQQPLPQQQQPQAIFVVPPPPGFGIPPLPIPQQQQQQQQHLGFYPQGVAGFGNGGLAQYPQLAMAPPGFGGTMNFYQPFGGIPQNPFLQFGANFPSQPMMWHQQQMVPPQVQAPALQLQPPQQQQQQQQPLPPQIQQQQQQQPLPPQIQMPPPLYHHHHQQQHQQLQQDPDLPRNPNGTSTTEYLIRPWVMDKPIPEVTLKLTDVEFSPAIPIGGQGGHRPVTNLLLCNEQGAIAHMAAWGDRATTLGCLRIGAIYCFWHITVRPLRNYGTTIGYSMLFTFGSKYKMIRDAPTTEQINPNDGILTMAPAPPGTNNIWQPTATEAEILNDRHGTVIQASASMMPTSTATLQPTVTSTQPQQLSLISGPPQQQQSSSSSSLMPAPTTNQPPVLSNSSQQFYLISDQQHGEIGQSSSSSSSLMPATSQQPLIITTTPQQSALISGMQQQGAMAQSSSSLSSSTTVPVSQVGMLTDFPLTLFETVNQGTRQQTGGGGAGAGTRRTSTRRTQPESVGISRNNFA